jgi:2Fe-2S ferredoxin
MTTIVFIEPNGTRHEIEAASGTSAMECAIRNGVPGIPADCGGACACATCHVYVDPQWLGKITPISGEENDLLDLADDRRDTSRLSCQIKITPDLDGLTLSIPAE